MPRRRTQETGSANGSPSTNGAAEQTEEQYSSLDEAVALRDLLRDATAKASVLVRSLKRDGKQAKLVRSTLASLRRLQPSDT